MTDNTILVTVFGGAVNAVVVLVATGILRSDVDFVDGTAERLSSWARFTLLGIALPFAVGAIMQAGLRQTIRGSPLRWELMLDTAATYFATNAVACFLIIPMILRVRPTYLRSRPPRRPAELVALLVVLLALAVVTLLQVQPILLFLIPVPLVVLVVRHGVLGAIAGSVVLVPVVITVTSAGVGQFVAIAGGDIGAGLQWAQLFLILVMAADFVMVALLDGQRAAAVDGRDESQVHRLVTENARDLIMLIDGYGRVSYASPNAVTVLGVAPDTLVGRGWSDELHPDDRALADRTFVALDTTADSATCLARIRHDDGTWRWVDTSLRLSPTAPGGTGRSVVAVLRDVTAEQLRRAEHERELRAAAGSDPLTGLPNRRHLTQALTEAWVRAEEASSPLTLLVVDVDRFKVYNDTYGHAGGDAALMAVARAIRAVLRRPHDVAARYGGEEFVLVLPQTDRRGGLKIAQALREEVRSQRIVHTGSGSGVLTVSIGVAVACPSGPDDGGLFAAADAALYRAKARGRDRIEVSDLGDSPGP